MGACTAFEDTLRSTLLCHQRIFTACGPMVTVVDVWERSVSGVNVLEDGRSLLCAAYGNNNNACWGGLSLARAINCVGGRAGSCRKGTLQTWGSCSGVRCFSSQGTSSPGSWCGRRHGMGRRLACRTRVRKGRVRSQTEQPSTSIHRGRTGDRAQRWEARRLVAVRLGLDSRGAGGGQPNADV